MPPKRKEPKKSPVSPFGDLQGFAKNLISLEKSPEQIEQEKRLEEQRRLKELEEESEVKSDVEATPSAPPRNNFDTLETEVPYNEDPFQRRLQALNQVCVRNR
eukprot:NODE_1981_length_793_cov_44.901882_g1573_i0.p2 GENE.NODE_1981_length_793_cov_44.901882_g1573_i0~~NODE_1981_length_793_cov_44.901882_g1573_i0.p2  ORF type:complete len:103 (-),score=18.62 NODE_1981_length_793_cov_44.901882_g1573_i0:409-717(-)